MDQLKPAEVAEKLRVSVKTLQRWDNEGIFVANRNPSGRRYYTEKQIKDYISTQNRISQEQVSTMTVFYISRGDISNHELLNSLISDVSAQKKYKIAHSKEKDAFVGFESDVNEFIKMAGLVLEDADRDVEISDEDYDKEIAIYKYSLVEYLECEWEGFDLTLSYGMGRNDTIEIPLSCQCENALDTIINLDWLLNVDDWYIDILSNTKQMVFNMMIANLKWSMQIEMNSTKNSEDSESDND